MKIIKLLLAILFISSSLLLAETSLKDQKIAVEALIKRIVPSVAEQIKVEMITKNDSEDIFEIEGDNGKITLRGSSGIAVASALNWYLKYNCNCSFAPVSQQLNLPKILPAVDGKIQHTTPYKYRTYYNYCTFSYTMPWWGWKEWQREVDLMAMNGINMPLQIVGQEAVWLETFKKFGVSSNDITDEFLVGPAYFAWGWMNNIDKIGGPLPMSWIKSHTKLGQQILKCQRSLGMTVVLQGFSGRVPHSFAKKYPNCKIKREHNWGSCPGTYQMDPLDPMFKKVGAAFIQTQTELFGTDHYYAADPFHEGSPPSKAPDYLAKVGKNIYETVTSVDPKAMWVMQSWSLRKDIILAAPKDRVIVFDLNNKNSFSKLPFWGRPTVYGILNNFGGRSFLSGNLRYTLNQASKRETKADNLLGLGLFDEATKVNPIIFEAFYENIWREIPEDSNQWLADYCHRRYGVKSELAEKAWSILNDHLYNSNSKKTSIIAARPALSATKADPNWNIEVSYNKDKLFEAWSLLVKAGKECGKQSGYNYDLVIIGRQMLTGIALAQFNDIVDAFNKKDISRFNKSTKEYLELLDDLERLLATEKQFLMGKWVKDARSWGTTEAEKNKYEYNARALVTLWEADEASRFFDYSWRNWSGLVGDYYKGRWVRWFNFLSDKLKKGESYSDDRLGRSHDRPWHSSSDWYKKQYKIEKAWVCGHSKMPSTPQGDALTICQKLIKKYAKVLPQQKLMAKKYGYTLNKVIHRTNPKKGKNTIIKSNITSGKPVKATVTEGINTASYAVDGKIVRNQYWAAGPSSKSRYLQIDLKTSIIIKNAKVWTYWDKERYYRYSIEVSEDGLAWQEVVDFSKNEKPSTAKGFLHKLKQPIKARHIRIKMLHNSANPSTHLIELWINAK